MKLLHIFLLMVFVSSHAFAQTVLPIDSDTNEYLDNVNCRLYSNNILVSTIMNKIGTTILLPPALVFDSISFSRVGYISAGMKKANVSKILRLQKIAIPIDEVIIYGRNREIVLGEDNKFISRYADTLRMNSRRGLVFIIKEDNHLSIKQIRFYVQKVKYQTIYNIKIFSFTKPSVWMGRQSADTGDPLYVSKNLTLNAKQKGEITVDIDREIILKSETIFVMIEVLDYRDENGIEIQPEKKDLTRLQLQKSDLANYYRDMVDHDSGEINSDLQNINAWINYDFAFHFHRKPGKETISAPVIKLVATRIEE